MSEERENLCAELTTIENDLVKQLIKAYLNGTDYRAFWEMVKRAKSFSQMRKDFCIS